MSKQRVLVLHNRYRATGGEERSVSAIVDLLERRGHAVAVVERDSSQLKGIRGQVLAGTALIRGRNASSSVVALAKEFEADVVHAHNILPLFGPGTLSKLDSAGFPIVMHLHNYRLFCAVATAFRDGAICHSCHGRNTAPAVRFNCRGSILESATYAAGLAAHTNTTISSVSRFLIPSAASLKGLERFGLPTGSGEVLMNFIGNDWFVPASSAGEGQFAIFVGRLSSEKGADLAIRVCAASDVPLVLAGTGPEEQSLRDLAANLGADCTFAGHLDAAKLTELRSQAAFALAPSRCEESCPYSVIESMAAGLPVVASNLGGLPELVASDSVVPIDDESQWIETTSRLWRDDSTRTEVGRATLERATKLFKEEPFYEQLSNVYRQVAA